MHDRPIDALFVKKDGEEKVYLQLPGDKHAILTREEARQLQAKLGRLK